MNSLGSWNRYTKVGPRKAGVEMHFFHPPGSATGVRQKQDFEYKKHAFISLNEIR